MSFVGIVSNRKCFDNIKNEIAEKMNNQDINFVQINLRSIENIKNIKFETIIIEDCLKKFDNNKAAIEKICDNAKYLIVNTDKNPKREDMKNEITYGLNQRATVTISSISDTDILVYLQKNLEDKAGYSIEIEERKIRKKDKRQYKTYEILIIYTFLKIYNNKIIDEI